MRSIEQKILNSTDEQLDTAFAVLKYPELGILRKIKCISLIFCIDFDEFTDMLPKSNDGRFLNKKCKSVIRDLLMKRVNHGQKEKQK